MRKKRKTNYGLLIVGIIIILGLSFFGAYKFYNYYSYNNLIKKANSYMDSGNYDKAIEAFKSSLSYKNDESISRNIELAESYLEDEKTFQKAQQLINDKKYLEAITELKKIKESNKKLYSKASDKIRECTEKYISVNMSQAQTAFDKGDFAGAKGYLSLVLAQDKTNKDALALMKKCEASITSKNNNVEGPLTKEQAAELIRSIKNFEGNIICKYDHDDTKANVEYYVIHAFESMPDHSATIGWYYVEKKSGKAFEWDLISDTLTPIN